MASKRSRKEEKGPEERDDGFLDDFERRIYGLLSDALQREECAARAAARLEFDIVQQHQDDREPPSTGTEGVDAAVPIETRDFSTAQFQSLFTNLNILRLVGDLAGLLQVQNRADEIASVMISDMFGRRPAATTAGRQASSERTLIGTDNEVLLERLREAAARKQRRG